MKTEQTGECKDTDKIEIKTEEKVSEFDGKTYTDFEFVIRKSCGYGVLLFNPPLVVHGSIEKGGDVAYYWYDFGMEDNVSVKKDSNFLYNYGGTNKECDPVQTVLNTVKYDLSHAFNHYQGDPNYGHTHWALYGNLYDRTIAYDWWEEDISEQLELDFS